MSNVAIGGCNPDKGNPRQDSFVRQGLYWSPGEPKLKRQLLAEELKGGADIEGVTLSNPEPVLNVRVR